MTWVCEGIDTADFGYGDPEVHECRDRAEWRMKEPASQHFAPEDAAGTLLCDFHLLRLMQHYVADNLEFELELLNMCTSISCGEDAVFRHIIDWVDLNGVHRVRKFDYCDKHSSWHMKNTINPDLTLNVEFITDQPHVLQAA
jgi:hypothetical protein